MKGFIEITKVGSSNATLINVNYIESVIQSTNGTVIFLINDNILQHTAKESYEEIVNKIEKAVEG